MRILLHICCGPCSIRVIQLLLEQGHGVTGFFYNPNIHPLAEYIKRRQGAVEVCQKIGIPLILADELPADEQAFELPAQCHPSLATAEGNESSHPWAETLASIGDTSVPLPKLPEAANPNAWLAAVSKAPAHRCNFCWFTRLKKTAHYAQLHDFEAISTTLLYSRWQQHDAIHATGNMCAADHSVTFYYEDFRTQWQAGITISKEWNIYRQQYCGCLYSEYERYAKELQKLCAS